MCAINLYVFYVRIVFFVSIVSSLVIVFNLVGYSSFLLSRISFILQLIRTPI